MPPQPYIPRALRGQLPAGCAHLPPHQQGPGISQIGAVSPRGGTAQYAETPERLTVGLATPAAPPPSYQLPATSDEYLTDREAAALLKLSLGQFRECRSWLLAQRPCPALVMRVPGRRHDLVRWSRAGLMALTWSNRR